MSIAACRSIRDCGESTKISDDLRWINVAVVFGPYRSFLPIGLEDDSLLGGIFGKKRRAEAVTFLPGVAQEYRDPAGKAIAAGRYWIFAPEAGEHAVLLLGTSPRLVASVVREWAEGRSTMIVQWVREASDDHRHHLAIDNVHLSCRGPETGAED